MAWLPGYAYRKPLVLTGGASGAQTDFQLDIDIAYVAAKMQADFDDIRFTQNNGTTLIDAWLESKVDSTSAETWAEFPTTPANTVEQTYYMYYGNAGAVSDWDGAATFLQYHGAATADYIDALVIPPTNVIYGARIRVTTTSRNIMFGLSNALADNDDLIRIEDYNVSGLRYLTSKNEGAFSQVSESPAWTVNQWYRIKITNDGTTSRGYVDDDEISTGLTTNLPNENLGLYMKEGIGSGEQDWAFVRKYAANPPTYAFGSEESAPTAGVRPPRVFAGPFAGPLGGPI